MVDATWEVVPGGPPNPAGSYHDVVNWVGGVVPDGVATFNVSTRNGVALSQDTSVGAWNFTGTGQFSFNIGGAVNTTLEFTGAGITGPQETGYATISNTVVLAFSGGSSAGFATITNSQFLHFRDSSTAGSALIENNENLIFIDQSSAGSAQITNNDYLSFRDSSTGGKARVINNSGAGIDFADNGTLGSIEGAGHLGLGFTKQTVGSLGGSQTVSGVISGITGSLTKVGAGTLTLSGANTYTGTTTVSKGTLILEGAALTTECSAFTIATGAKLKGDVVFAGAGRDVVTNKGTIVGSFDMGAGNDSFTGTLGGVAKVVGGNGNDTLVGGAKADIFDGGQGADKLTGRTGKDRLTGGLSADDFIFTNVADSRAAARDTIVDFNRAQGDDIWLNAIDANTQVAGNQAFAFIGKAAFSGVAGQLRYQKMGADTHIMGDINGDRVADITIISDKVINFARGDFVL